MYEPGEEVERILDELERVVVSVLDAAGLDPNHSGPTRPRSPQGGSEIAAVFCYRQIENLRADIKVGRNESAVCRALQLMYAFMEAKFEQTKGVELEAFKKSRSSQMAGWQRRNEQRKREADKKYGPYRKRLREYEGTMGAAAAFEKVAGEMAADGIELGDKSLQKHMRRSAE